MRIVIAALGSRGDVLPYAALGAGLRRAGHEVWLAAFETYRHVAATNGLSFLPVRGDVQAILGGKGGLALAESGRSVVRMAGAVLRTFGSLAQGYATDLGVVTRLQPDAIVSQLPGQIYAHSLAEASGARLVAAAVMPLVPSARDCEPASGPDLCP